MFTCPFCMNTTRHPRDVEHSYCPRCHVFATDVRDAIDVLLLPVHPPALRVVSYDECQNVPVELGLQILNLTLHKMTVGAPILMLNPANKAPLMPLPRDTIRHARIVINNHITGAR